MGSLRMPRGCLILKRHDEQAVGSRRPVRARTSQPGEAGASRAPLASWGNRRPARRARSPPPSQPKQAHFKKAEKAASDAQSELQNKATDSDKKRLNFLFLSFSCFKISVFESPLISCWYRACKINSLFFEGEGKVFFSGIYFI